DAALLRLRRGLVVARRAAPAASWAGRRVFLVLGARLGLFVLLSEQMLLNVWVDDWRVVWEHEHHRGAQDADDHSRIQPGPLAGLDSDVVEGKSVASVDHDA